jgi:hypothetical protein
LSLSYDTILWKWDRQAWVKVQAWGKDSQN